jgi:hypothetical protein
MLGDVDLPDTSTGHRYESGRLQGGCQGTEMASHRWSLFETSPPEQLGFDDIPWPPSEEGMIAYSQEHIAWSLTVTV